MAEEGRRLNRRDFGKLLLGVIAGGSVGAATGGAAGSASSGDFVQRNPAATQIVKSPVVGATPIHLDFIDRGVSLDALRIIRDSDNNFRHDFYPNQFRLHLPDGSSEVIVPFVLELLPSGTVVSFMFFDYGGIPSGNRELVWGDDTQPDFLNTQRFILPKGLGSASRFLFQSDTFLLDSVSETTTLPAGVGQPTGSGGTTGGINRVDHRHAFSGRFLDSSLTLPVALGPAGPFPLNIGLRLNANNWTLRRLTVYAMVAPAGGTETYGIVNAAGALQGTAVVLPAGALFAVGALQVTNLVTNVNYFFAQTASGAVTPSNNTQVKAEYTMNV